MDRDSLENLVDYWFWEVNHLRPSASLIIVGTRADERDQMLWFDSLDPSASDQTADRPLPKDVVLSEAGLKVARDLGALFYIEVDLYQDDSRQDLSCCSITCTKDVQRPRATATPSKSRKKNASSKKASKKPKNATESRPFAEAFEEQEQQQQQNALCGGLSLSELRSALSVEMKALAKSKKKTG